MRIVCPESFCHADNDAQAEFCVQCHLPLKEYTKLLTHPNHLFNQGLAHARARNFQQARDLFAAVVYWYPRDLEARNALAAACFATNDFEQAHHHWGLVYKDAPRNTPTSTLAKQGLDNIQRILQAVHESLGDSRDKPIILAKIVTSKRSGKQKERH